MVLQEAESLLSQKHGVQEELQAAQRQAASLSAQLEEARREGDAATTLSAELMAARKEMAAASALVSVERERSAALERARVEAQQQLQGLMLQKESLQAAIEKSQRQQTASDARHEQDDGDALAEVEAARKEMAAASALLFVERERRSAAEAAREKAQQRADAAQQRADAAAQEQQRLRQELDRAAAAAEQRDAELAQVQAELLGLREAAEEEAAALDLQLEEVRQEVAAATAMGANLEAARKEMAAASALVAIERERSAALRAEAQRVSRGAAAWCRFSGLRRLRCLPKVTDSCWLASRCCGCSCSAAVSCCAILPKLNPSRATLCTLQDLKAAQQQADSLKAALEASQREAAELAAQLESARREAAAARALMPADLSAQLEQAREAVAMERKRSSVLEQAWGAAQEVSRQPCCHG